MISESQSARSPLCPEHRGKYYTTYSDADGPAERKMSVIESLDYDLFSNEVKEKSGTFVISNWVPLKRWLLTLCVSFVTAGVAIFVTFCTRRLTELKFNMGRSMFDSDFSAFAITLLFTIFNLVCVTLAVTFVYKIEPKAAGSGIPEIKCLLNGIKIPRVVRIRTLLAKVGGVIFSCASGLPVGKEGPMIHAGAVVSICSVLKHFVAYVCSSNIISVLGRCRFVAR